MFNYSNSFIVIALCFICAYIAARSRHTVSRCGLPPPGMSPWSHLYANGDDTSFLSLTGFDRGSFDELHDIIFSDEDSQEFGRPRSLDSFGELGLLLHYLNF